MCMDDPRKVDVKMRIAWKVFRRDGHDCFLNVYREVGKRYLPGDVVSDPIKSRLDSRWCTVSSIPYELVFLLFKTRKAAQDWARCSDVVAKCVAEDVILEGRIGNHHVIGAKKYKIIKVYSARGTLITDWPTRDSNGPTTN